MALFHLLILINIKERERQRKKDKNIDIEKENTQDKLSETAKLILQAVNEKGEITSKEVANIIGKSQKTAVRELKKLIDNKLLVWTGKWEKDKAGKYKLP